MKTKLEGDISGKIVSIIIPTKDKISRLRIILKALECQVEKNMEVVVVFDGCSSETLLAFKKLRFGYDVVTVVCEENRGRACARNQGIIHSGGDVLIFLDDDRIPAPCFVKYHLSFHDKPCIVLGERKQIDIPDNKLTGFYENFSDINTLIDKKKIIVYPDSNLNTINRIIHKKPGHRLRWLTFYTGNVSLRRELVMCTNLFDENFTGWGYEDTELGYRFAKSGLPYIKAEKAVNYHIMHSIDRAREKHEGRRNLYYFIKKYDYKPSLLLALYGFKFLYILKTGLNFLYRMIGKYRRF